MRERIPSARLVSRHTVVSQTRSCRNQCPDQQGHIVHGSSRQLPLPASSSPQMRPEITHKPGYLLQKTMGLRPVQKRNLVVREIGDLVENCLVRLKKCVQKHQQKKGSEIKDHAPSLRVRHLRHFESRYVNFATSSDRDTAQRQLYYNMLQTTLKRVREFGCHHPLHFQKKVCIKTLLPSPLPPLLSILSERPRAVTISSTFEGEGGPACYVT